MKVKKALALAARELAAHGSPAAELEARLLLMHLLQVRRTTLIVQDERQLTPGQEEQFRALLAQACRHFPIPYLLGHAPFFDLDILVTPDVLIPRPETEQLVTLALAWATAEERPGLLPVDVGTGSGCIALMLARRLPQSLVLAGDISAAALAVAQSNMARSGLAGRIALYQGDLLAPLPAGRYLVVANLPYVGDDEWGLLDESVKRHEPALALRGGWDGLEVVRRLLRQAQARLQPGGALFLELGWQQGAAAAQMAAACWPGAAVTLQADYAGIERYVSVALPAHPAT